MVFARPWPISASYLVFRIATAIDVKVLAAMAPFSMGCERVQFGLTPDDDLDRRSLSPMVQGPAVAMVRPKVRPVLGHSFSYYEEFVNKAKLMRSV